MTKKCESIHENKDRFGEEFKGIFEKQVVRLAREVKLSDFESTGEFKDEDDIKEIYKNKPAVRDWILLHAKTIQAQGQTLYEDLKFKSVKRDRQESIEEHQDKLGQEEKVKPKGKSRSKPKPEIDSGTGEVVPPKKN